jgi:alpha-ketoglutaric semialdehyde dehydrogenase
VPVLESAVTPKPVLIAGVWRTGTPAGLFTAFDPTTGSALPDAYPVSPPQDVEMACEAGREAAVTLQSLSDAPSRIAAFLDDYAARIEAAADALVEMAARETAYPAPTRLRAVELPRTTSQIRQGAAAARDRSWCQATIDTKLNIRSMFEPLGGPVAVFGPNNFPFAFNSIAGGDFVAAIAAGNPVIGKANTSHPGTSRLFAELAFEAVRAHDLPPAMVQLIYRTPPDAGFALVSHPALAATGFTGSKHAGLQLKAAADRAGKPIYLEMSSVNPVFVLPGALEERSDAIARELFDSCALGGGQFCTRPALTIVAAGDAAETFIARVQSLFEQGATGTLLGASGVSSIAGALDVLRAHGAELLAGGSAADGPRYAFANTLLRASGQAFLAAPDALQTEAFGTVNTIVVARDVREMRAIAAALDGNLTGCLYTHRAGADDEAYAAVASVLRQRVGRLLNDKMPTGVAVSPAMNHGGPYPATGHPGFTAVGIPASLRRFAALQCYDNVRPHRLPPELADANPTGTMWRLVDGAWSQASITGVSA